MSELAFNVNGERFDVPDEAEFWRVRRFKPSGRGTPEVVFDPDGLPLVIPIDTDIHEFRRLVEMQPGRYRLDPIDADQKGCDDGTAAYVQLADASGAPSSAGADSPAAAGSRQDDLIRDLVRVNADMVKSITEKFATVMESAATLIRAADGAGMPARQPVVMPQVEDAELEDDDEDDDHRNAGGFDLGSFLAQMMPMFQMVMAQRNQANGNAAQTRNAAVEDDEDDDDFEDEVEEDDDADDEPAASAAPVQPPGPEAMAHFAAIQSKLTPEEAQLAQAVAAELPPQEINGWIAELSKLPVDDAVELIRETIRKSRASAGDGGAS